MDGGFFGSWFDLNQDGEMDIVERTIDAVMFQTLDKEEEENEN